MPGIRVDVRQRDAADAHLPRVGREQPEQQPQDRRLSAAGRADQRDALAGREFQREALECRSRRVGVADRHRGE